MNGVGLRQREGQALTELDESLRLFEARLTGPKGPFELTEGPHGSPKFAAGPHCLHDIYSRARRSGDKLLVSQGAESGTYSQTFERAFGLAEALIRDGRQDQRIALLLDDGPEWLTWFIAITAAGASCVLPPSGAPRDMITRCFATAGCHAIVALGGEEPASSLVNLYRIKAQPARDGSPASVTPEHEALVTFTSGSLGEPKGVIHTHRSLLTGLRNMMLAGALSSHMLGAPTAGSPRPQPPVTLVLSPLSYIAGYSAFLLTLVGGGRLVLGKDADGAAAIAAVVQAQSVQAISGASVDLLRRLIRLQNASVTLQTLRRLQLHGAALQPQLIEEIAATLPDLVPMTGYGMSETAGAIAAAPVSQLLGAPGKCGRVLPSVNLRIVDDAGVPASSGHFGNIEVRGDMIMSGYLDEARTAAAFKEGRWYRSGDIGALDAAGWLTVLDRDDARLTGRTGDANGFIAPIEDAIRAHDGVDDAAVTSSPRSDDLAVYVQARPGASPIPADIAAIVMRISGLQGLVLVHMVDTLPRTASGKVDRRRLEA